MTRKGLWIEVRYRLVVLAVTAAVLASFAVALRGSVHVGAARWFWDDPVATPYRGQVTGWNPGQADLSGWAENRSDAACPWMIVRLHYGPHGQPLGDGPPGEDGWFWVAADVPAHSRFVWSGRPLGADDPNRVMTFRGRPDASFACSWPLPPGENGVGGWIT